MNYKKLVESLRKKGWVIEPRALKKLFGKCSYKNKKIQVDVNRSIATVLVHELIHADNDELPEVVVRALETVAISQLSNEECAKLVHLLGVKFKEGP